MSEDQFPIDDKNNDERSENQEEISLNDVQEEVWDSFNSGIIRKTDYFDLFISYKRDNGGDHGQELAVKLYDKLTADGYKIWLDNQEIGYSSNFERRIEEAIIHSKKFVCILGPEWVNSPNCRFEVQKAIGYQKRIIPAFYQEFRSHLLEKRNEGVLTHDEWIRIDKPQEVHFGDSSNFEKAYQDLRSLCDLKDEVTHFHTRILCESYYWEKFTEPKSMLLVGNSLSKVKLLRTQCNGDDELPSFTSSQDSFLKASEDFVKTEISTKRKVFLSFDLHELDYAADLDMELRLNNISTLYDVDLAGEEKDNSFIKAILNCENVIDIVTDLGEVEEDHRISFARANNKPVIRITNSHEIRKEHQERGVKNVYYWDANTDINTLITTINGDKVYNAQHSKLLDDAYEWKKSDKHPSKLMSYREAILLTDWYLNAEKLGTEPQPNSDMVNFVDRSVNHAVISRKKKRLKFSATIIGLAVLIVLGFTTWYLIEKDNQLTIEKDAAVKRRIVADKNSEEAIYQAHLSTIAKNKSDSLAKLSNEAATNSNIKAELSDKARTRAEKAEKKANQEAARSLKEARKAENNFIIAESLTETAEANLKVAQDSLDKATAFSAQGLKMLNESKQELIKAQTLLAETRLIASKYRAISDARNQTMRSLRFYRSGDKELALLSANKAYALLPLDSSSLPMQIQSLHVAYSNLLPKSSVLNSGNKGDDKSLSKMSSNLQKRDDIKKNIYGLDSTVIKLGGIDISVRHGKNSVSESNIQNILKISKYKNVTAISVSSSNEWIAFGYKSGEVIVFDMNSKEVLEEINDHTSKINSITFSPNGKILTISSNPNELRIVHLMDDGRKNEFHEIIAINANSKIQHIYYWNDDVLITVDHNKKAMAWVTNLAALKKEVEAE